MSTAKRKTAPRDVKPPRPSFLDVPPSEDESPEVPERLLTINGNPIPPEFAHAIPYAHTDQGIAERENNGKPRAMCQVTRDAWDKTIDKRAAATEPWEAEDPLKDTVDAHRQPGMAYRFLSERVINKRGLRKYEIVTDGKGNEVKVGNMRLGTMPIELQNKRARHYEDKGNDDLASAKENLQIAQDQIARDNPEVGRTHLQSGERLRDYNSGETHDIGITRHRGAL